MATSDDNPFTEAPEEVTRYFDSKRRRPSYDWRDVAPYEHATDFTVAKTTGYDVLEDIRKAVSDARRNYKDFGEFADELEPILRKKGWWGFQKHPETGEVVRLGALHRLRTIYWANMSTARAAGEWERTQRTKRALPFLIYELSSAENKRPLHVSWVGTILPVDHVWWTTHYPPNGWLCKCRVRQITRREALRNNYDPDAPAPAVETYRWTNARTGEVVEVPKGIDPGWQGNPGLRRVENAQKLLAGRLAEMSDAQRSAAVADLTSGRKFRAIADGDFPYRGPGDHSPENRALGHVAEPVASLPDDLARLMQTDAPVVEFSVADAHHQRVEKRDERSYLSAPDYGVVQKMLLQGRMARSIGHDRTFGFSVEHEGTMWWAATVRTADGKRVFLRHLYKRGQNGGLPSKGWMWVD
ncbi:MAG: phage minor head protein [Paracoccus sp. (in: a-proteobacteria)]|uniref:phage head morphogenesis protein n=1 Tax=Paracoccus sp. TaxID=267 RepID=UPI0026E099C1|nr:phage minor head protein [Paracoccus sp. (in: a-proteobacteria)]MDO5631127.1 phage minor head protein [Paracoccus sp. (in: a-proteobacteria)]